MEGWEIVVVVVVVSVGSVFEVVDVVGVWVLDHSRGGEDRDLKETFAFFPPRFRLGRLDRLRQSSSGGGEAEDDLVEGEEAERAAGEEASVDEG